MKILFLTLFYPPTHIGGTENYTHGLAKGMLRAGHQVSVMCANKWETGERCWDGFTEDVHEGVRVHRFDMNWVHVPDPNRYLYDNPFIAQKLADYLQNHRPDVVHITSCITMSASAIRTIRQLDIPVVITLTDFWFLCPRTNLVRGDGSLCDGQITAEQCIRCMLGNTKLYQNMNKLLPRTVLDSLFLRTSRYSFLTRLRGLRGLAIDIRQRKTFLLSMLALADHVISPSMALKEIFERNGVQRPIQVVPYGHDLSWLESYSGKTPSNKVRFGYLGQILPIKGVHLLIEASQSLDHSSHHELFVFGDLEKDSSYSLMLKRTAGNSPHIKFMGTFAHQQLARVLEQIDIIVVPSTWHENNPLVIQEAFAAETPVIATNLGGMQEFVHHQVNGLVFERGDVRDLAKQMQAVINTPGLLGRLKTGISVVRRIEEEVQAILGIYGECIHRDRVRKDTDSMRNPSGSQ
jgi:glycosyltransferase involved in cell wall biosynthesis